MTESTSEPAPATQADPAPATPAEPAAASQQTAPSPGDEASSNRTTWILFGAAWVVAAVVLAVQAPAIGRQLKLRSLRQGVSAPQPKVDQEAADALVAEGKGAIRAIADELAQADPEREAFRALLAAKVLGPMEGPEATQLLIALTQDGSPGLRANAYEALAERALAERAPRALVTEALFARSKDSDGFAQAVAGRSLVRLGDERGLWPMIDGLRRLPTWAYGSAPTILETLRAALKAPGLQLDLSAPPEARLEQVRAIEAAYLKHGGVIPPGQDLETLLKAQPAGSSTQPESPPGTSPEPTPAAGGSPTQGAEQQ